MTLKMKKYRLKAWYRQQSDDVKRMVRSQYVATFQVGERQFYETLIKENIAAAHLEFFAKVSGHSMEELIAVPLEIRSYDKPSMDEMAKEFGLSK